MHSVERGGRRSACAGRAELAWVVAAASAGALLAVVLLGWLPERAHSHSVDAQSAGLQLPSGEAAALAEAIGKLDQRLARMEAALAVQSSRGTREAASADVAPSSGTSVPSIAGPEGLDELHKDLLQMSKRVDLLAGSLKETYKPAYLLPTLEQIHAARHEVDWTFLEQVRLLVGNDRDAARARVRFMTFDDVLRKIGLPNSINTDDGRWNYVRTVMGENGQPMQQGITLAFVGDTASGVNTFP